MFCGGGGARSPNDDPQGRYGATSRGLRERHEDLHRHPEAADELEGGESSSDTTDCTHVQYHRIIYFV